jgi:Domain of unknown function (DUF4142)
MKELIVVSIALGFLLMGQSSSAQSVSAPVESQALRGVLIWPEGSTVSPESQFVMDHVQNSATQAKLSEIAARKARTQRCRNFAQRNFVENNMIATSLLHIAALKGIPLPAFIAVDQQRVNSISDLPKGVFTEAYLAVLSENQFNELLGMEYANRPANLNPRLQAWADQRMAFLSNDIVEASYVGDKSKEYKQWLRHGSEFAVSPSNPGM